VLATLRTNCAPPVTARADRPHGRGFPRAVEEARGTRPGRLRVTPAGDLGPASSSWFSTRKRFRSRAAGVRDREPSRISSSELEGQGPVARHHRAVRAYTEESDGEQRGIAGHERGVRSATEGTRNGREECRRKKRNLTTVNRRSEARSITRPHQATCKKPHVATRHRHGSLTATADQRYTPSAVRAVQLSLRYTPHADRHYGTG